MELKLIKQRKHIFQNSNILVNRNIIKKSTNKILENFETY